MTRSTNMEHLEVLREMRNRWAMPSEVAALDAAIASLSAPQSWDNQGCRDQLADLLLTDPETGEPCDIVSTLRRGPGGFQSFDVQSGPDGAKWRIEFRVSESGGQDANPAVLTAPLSSPASVDAARQAGTLSSAPQPPAEPTNRAESSSKLVDGQPPAEAQPVAWIAQCELDSLAATPGGRSAHGVVWSRPTGQAGVPIYAAPPSAPVGVEADAAGEDILTRALNSAYEHGARQAVFPLSDCARQVREALAQQPADVDLYVYDDSRGPCSDGCCGGCFYSAYEGQQGGEK